MEAAVAQAQCAAESMPLALPVALEHASLSIDPGVLCAAACVCRPWRSAVQQCSACNTVVVLGPNPAAEQLASFGCWLPKHAALVRSISVSLKDLDWNVTTVHGVPWQGYLSVARQLLLGCLQAASTAPIQPAAASSHASTEQQQQQQHAWRLASFSSDLPGAAALLPALPGHSLAHLQLDLQHDTAVDAPALSAALAELSSLHFLCLRSTCNEEKAVPASCLAGIEQLRQLTELQLHNCWSNLDQPLQQLLAQPLPLRKLLLHVRSDLPDLNLVHLTQLEVLEHTWGSVTPQSTLPQQLQRLQLGTVECDADLAIAMQLPALQWLSILARGPDPTSLLLQLAQHSSLQQLALVYDGSDEALATAAVWKQLPQLRELSMQWENSIPSKEQGAAIVAGIAAATALTKLVFTAQVLTEGSEDEEYGEPPPMEVAVCASLAALTNLRHLELDCYSARLAPGDAFALSALTNLTRLVSRGGGSEMGQMQGRGVAGPAVAAVAASLAQLRHLELDQCDMADAASLAAVGRLVQLTELRLEGVGGVTLQGLELLSRLSRLQQLTLQISREVTNEALQAFAGRLGVAKVVGVSAPLRQPSVRYWTFEDYGTGCLAGGEGLEDSDELEEGDGDEESDEFEDCYEYEESDENEGGDGSGEAEGDAAQ